MLYFIEERCRSKRKGGVMPQRPYRGAKTEENCYEVPEDRGPRIPLNE
jgi:hypothetical protein